MEDVSQPFRGLADTEHGPDKIGLAVAGRMRELREEKSWTRTDLARELGTTPSQVQKMEDGLLNISLKWMQRLARTFGVKMAALLPPEENDFSTSPEMQELAAVFYDVPPAARHPLLTAAKAVTATARTIAVELGDRTLPGDPVLVQQMSAAWARWDDMQRQQALHMMNMMSQFGER